MRIGDYEVLAFTFPDREASREAFKAAFAAVEHASFWAVETPEGEAMLLACFPFNNDAARDYEYGGTSTEITTDIADWCVVRRREVDFERVLAGGKELRVNAHYGEGVKVRVPEPHNCFDNAVEVKTEGPLGHGWECGICHALLQVG